MLPTLFPLVITYLGKRSFVELLVVHESVEFLGCTDSIGFGLDIRCEYLEETWIIPRWNFVVWCVKTVDKTFNRVAILFCEFNAFYIEVVV